MPKEASPLPAAIDQILNEVHELEENELVSRLTADTELKHTMDLYDKFDSISEKFGKKIRTSMKLGLPINRISVQAEYRATPPVRIATPKGSASIQIVERIAPETTHYYREGFDLKINGETRFFISPTGITINWVHEKSTKEQRDIISKQILDPLGQELERKTKPKKPESGPRVTTIKQVIKDLGLDKKEPAKIRHGRQPSNNKRPTIRKTKPLVPKTPTERRYSSSLITSETRAEEIQRNLPKDLRGPRLHIRKG